LKEVIAPLVNVSGGRGAGADNGGGVGVADREGGSFGDGDIVSLLPSALESILKEGEE